MPPALYPLLRTTTPQADPGLPHTLAISDVNDLQNMNNNKAGNYYLTGNINASVTSGWNGGAGFIPVGDSSTKFTGTLDGCGHTISGLFINRPSLDGVGLFGRTGPGIKIANVRVADCDIRGNAGRGALVGIAYDDVTGSISIYNCSSSGFLRANETGPSNTGGGGLVGWLQLAEGPGYIYDSHSSCCIVLPTEYGGSGEGGLVGLSVNSTIRNCYATGQVGSLADYEFDSVGGLVGIASGTLIEYSFATGNVYGDTAAGGFVGELQSDAEVKKCYCTGNVYETSGDWSNQETGGFVGVNSGNIYDCYCWGTVTATVLGSEVGGFVGQATYSGSIYTNCYSKGAVIGGSGISKGGWMGGGAGVGTGVFWDKETSGMSTSPGSGSGAGEVGRTTRQMGKQANFPTYDFDTVWYMPVSDRQIIMGRPRTSYPVRGKHTAHRNIYG